MKKKSNITIVGVGALGSHLVQFLRNMPHNIKVIDYDRVEMKNVQAQFFGQANIGAKKTAGLKQLMQFMFKRKVSEIGNKLTSDNVEVLLKDADLIIDCLDNAEARTAVQKFARANDIQCLHGALAANGELGRVIWDEHFTIDAAPPGQATCENGDHLPFIAATAAFLAQSAQIYLETSMKSNFSITATNVFKI